MVCASAKTGRAFIAHAEGDQSAFFEIKRKIGFGSRSIVVDKAAVDANHFQRAFFQIVSLFRIQGQDLPGDLTMSAVGSPEALGRRNDGDDWIEVASGVCDHISQSLVMSIGKITLKWR